MLGISHRHLYDLLNAGELESFKIGGARHIPVESIRRYIAARLNKFPKGR
jgi:excisionase family DNA binding protein